MAAGNDEFNQTDPVDLAGMTAVVTGSSAGIGKAIAENLASKGAAVLIHGNTRRTEAENTADTIRRSGGESTAVMADLSVPSQADDLVARAWDWHNGVDLWVNCAGADVLTGPTADWPFEKKLQLLWDVDVVATIRLSRDIGQRMQRQAAHPRYSILNIGWDQAECGMSGDSGEMFSTIKGAVMAFTKSLAKSLAPQVRVNCLAPGWIKTAWGDTATEYWQRRACQESLMGRWGTPADIGHAAHFLLSPSASFITGQVIAVNGGFCGSENRAGDTAHGD